MPKLRALAEMKSELRLLKKKIEAAKLKSQLAPFKKMILEAHKVGRVGLMEDACREVLINTVVVTINPAAISHQVALGERKGELL